MDLQKKLQFQENFEFSAQSIEIFINPLRRAQHIRINNCHFLLATHFS